MNLFIKNNDKMHLEIFHVNKYFNREINRNFIYNKISLYS